VSEAGGALGDVKEAFQGKRGKVLLIGGGVAIAVYVWWTRRNGTPEELPDEMLEVDGPSGRNPQTDPEVGNTNTGNTGNGRKKYENNAEWLADGTDFLAGRGTPSAAAYDALTKALAGLALTSQQIAWVSQVISALGAPPEGMPPLNAAPPAGTGGTQGNPKPIPPKPTAPKPAPKPSTASYVAVRVVKYTSKNPPWNSTLSGIGKHYGKSWVTVWNDSKNASLRKLRGSPNKIRPGDVVYVKK
jgi:hypothetical protein